MSDNNSIYEKRVMVITGEASGDLHGSNLVYAAKKVYPGLSFYGVGGEKMAEAGCELLFSSNELAVMGLFEIFGQLPRIIRRFKQLKKVITGDNPPDVLVLIDFPDFNLRLAKVAKAVGVPVLYYITPKVWAWRKRRAKTIAENTDRLAVIFPFEPEIFAPYGGRAEYVGNPLLDEFVTNQPSGDLRNRLGLTDSEQVVGIFPGSRHSELKYILDTLIQTALLIHAEKPKVKFLIPVAPSLDDELIREKFAGLKLPVVLLRENIYEVSHACDAVLCVSGTVTLQIALTATPMAILYKISPFSYEIGRRLIKIPYAGLTNIVAGKGIVREFIQDDAEPCALKDEILRLLDDSEYANVMRNDLEQVKQQLGQPGCSEKVAKIIHDLVLF